MVERHGRYKAQAGRHIMLASCLPHMELAGHSLVVMEPVKMPVEVLYVRLQYNTWGSTVRIRYDTRQASEQVQHLMAYRMIRVISCASKGASGSCTAV